MNQYERGVHEPGEATARQIAKTLKLPLAWFYCEDEETALLLQYFNLLSETNRLEVIDLAMQLAPFG
jgi:transcriptional regulator with XRE-family HTH domain